MPEIATNLDNQENVSTSEVVPAWPEQVKLFQQFQVEQILLAEQASCLSVQAFLAMCNLTFDIEMRCNAEFMSPTQGKMPFLKCGDTLVADFEPIINFIQSKGITLTDHLDSSQVADMKAYMSLINSVLLNAELYVNWLHEKTYRDITKFRYGNYFPWPLNHLLTWKNKRENIAKLKAGKWAPLTLDIVYDKVNECCQSLSDRLGDQPYFFGDKPTELDALVFGHLFAILITALPEINLVNVVRSYSNLMELCRRIDAKHFQRYNVDE